MNIPTLTDIKDEAVKRALESLVSQLTVPPALLLADGVGVAPQSHTKQAAIYIDPVTGDLMIVFGDGTRKLIVVDT